MKVDINVLILCFMYVLEPSSAARKEVSSVITLDKFNKACETNGGAGGYDHYSGFLKALKIAGVNQIRGALYLLAACVWESQGLSQLSDKFCEIKQNGEECKRLYGSGPDGVIYYGRGPMRLTNWTFYKQSSQLVFEDDFILINHPELVASNLTVGWRSTGWYWHLHVLFKKIDTFGESLKALYGKDACKGGRREREMFPRCDHYRKILPIFDTPLPNREIDCVC